MKSQIYHQGTKARSYVFLMVSPFSSGLSGLEDHHLICSVRDLAFCGILIRFADNDAGGRINPDHEY